MKRVTLPRSLTKEYFDRVTSQVLALQVKMMSVRLITTESGTRQVNGLSQQI
jgi:hypothetical protein